MYELTCTVSCPLATVFLAVTFLPLTKRVDMEVPLNPGPPPPSIEVEEKDVWRPPPPEKQE